VSAIDYLTRRRRLAANTEQNIATQLSMDIALGFRLGQMLRAANPAEQR
jgi:hypothetical protein